MAKFLKIFVIILISFFILAAGWFVYWIHSLPIPDFKNFEEIKIIQSTKIYDRTGKNLLYDIHKNIKRTVVPYEEISKNIKNATVAIEDSEFYQHKGINIFSIIRALLKDIFSGKIKQGGSTITQQLVKNTFLTPEKSLARKIKEIILAIKIEKHFSKEKILTLYLNEIPYGGSIYGIEAAAESYFGKHAKDLSLAESAYLAALPKAPSYYSPYGIHKDELENRKNFILKRMLELGFITQDQYQNALKEKVVFLNPKEKGIQAPHFVMYIKSYLEKKYGKDLVEQGGLKIITTLNLNIQREAEKLVFKYSKENEKKFNAKNAGLVAIDPKTGQILAMVGSRNYFDNEIEGKFNITLAKRQPGSSFKPFVYATAFKKGYTPQTIVFDLKTEFNTSCNPDGTPKPGIDKNSCYHPQNYDHIYRGPISLKDALAQSVNIPAVKVLYLAGIKDSLKTAQDLGITTLNDPSRYGLTLVLGGGEVTLLEMTGAYSVFANDGIKNPITGILKITDSKGNIIEEFKPHPQRVLDKNIAREINEILSDNEARAPAFGQHSYLYFPGRKVAVKTGTTNNYKDAWVIGYTPNFALGVWCGNNDNSPMIKKVAGFIAAPLWHAVFEKIFQTLPKEDFPPPERNLVNKNLKPILRGYWQGGKVYYIDKISKKLATKFTPPELIKEKILTQVHSILYWVDKNNPLGEAPQNPEKDPQFILWETPVRNWVKNQRIKEESEKDIPKEYDDIHKPEFVPKIEINYLKKDKNIELSFKPKSKFGLKQLDFYLNDIYLGTITPPPYKFIFNPNKYQIYQEKKLIKIIVYDKVGNKNEYNIKIN